MAVANTRPHITVPRRKPVAAASSSPSALASGPDANQRTAINGTTPTSAAQWTPKTGFGAAPGIHGGGCTIATGCGGAAGAANGTAGEDCGGPAAGAGKGGGSGGGVVIAESPTAARRRAGRPKGKRSGAFQGRSAQE